MTLPELNTNISAAINDGSLVLDSRFGQEFEQLAGYLKLTEIALEETTADTSNEALTLISGVTVFNGKSYQANLEITQDTGESLFLVLGLSPTDEDWLFSDFTSPFPEMSTVDPSPNVTSGIPSLFDSFIPDNPLFVVSNGDLSGYDLTLLDESIDLATGINFLADLDLSQQEYLATDPTLQLVLNISSSGTPLKLQGTIELTDTTPIIYLEGSLPALRFDLGTFALEEVSLEFLTTDPEGEKPVTSLKLACSIALGEEIITLTTGLLEGNSTWSLYAEFDPDFLSLASGFSALASLAGGSESDLQLPAGLSGLASFYLASLNIAFDPAEQSLQAITFTIATSEPWNTPIPNFSILEINTSWTYLFLPTENSISGVVTGLLEIGSSKGAVNLDVTANMPDFNITAQLPYGDQIAVKDLLNYYFGNTVTFDTNMMIDQFVIFADPTQQTYSLTSAFADVWDIATDSFTFSLDPVNVNMYYDNTGLALSMGAQFNLALSTEEGETTNIVFVISAQKAPEGQGWQFQGQQAPGVPISVGTLISYIADLFDAYSDNPDNINDLTINDLGFSFNTTSKDFSFSGEIDFPVSDTTNLALSLEIMLSQAQDGSYSKNFAGGLTLGSGDGALTFDITLDQTDTGSIMIGSYLDATGKSISLSELLSNTMGVSIPDVLTFTLNNALYLYDQPNSETTRQLFAAQMGNGLDLAAIPLLGNLIGSNPIRLDYQFLIPSGTFEPSDLSNINTMLPEGFPALPADQTLSSIGINITLLIGDKTIPLSLPISINNEDSTTEGTSSGSEASSSPPESNTSPVVVDNSSKAEDSEDTESGTWFTIQKQLGPVYFEKIGLNYSDSKLWFLIEAALKAGGLTISFDGLGVGTPLTSFDPTFSLTGLGVDYESGNTNIGGSLMATQDEAGNDIYSGSITVTTSSLSVSALGSFASVNGSSSLFIYATINKALGGPSFFYVTGVAAAFGYNRQLIMPSIEEVNQFPLVTTAMEGTVMPSSGDQQSFLTDVLNEMNSYIPPAQGEYFLAAGVAFTTYNLLSSFALLAVSFGNKFRIDILGLSNMVVPPESDDFILAEMQLALTASFVPDDGILQVTAQLTDGSYFLSPDCQLTGGFAFYSWFSGEHEGDFVLSIGGYHPDFNVPSHYPSVPRLGFNWQVDDSITLSGDAYFALCAHAFMVGGSFSAVYASGSFEASFNLGADFLISWQPYYYSASIYASLGCDYTYELFGTHTISIELGADLAIAGPDFGGSASVTILIFTIKIKFGDQDNNSPDPISYSAFKDSFLPASNGDDSESGICAINFTSGVTGQTSGETPMDIVNPKKFIISTSTMIPATAVVAIASNGEDDDRVADGQMDVSLEEYDTGVGIAPMDLDESGVLMSTHTITILRDEYDIGDEFAYTPISKKMPKAVWGTEISTGVNDAMYMSNAVGGVEIVPYNDSKPGVTKPIDAANLAFDTTPVTNAFQWETYQPNTARVLKEPNEAKATVNSSMNSDSSATSRASLMDSMGLTDVAIDVGEHVGDGLLYEPIVY